MSKTRVLLNGKIYTVNKEQPWAEAVVIEDDKIAYVGDNEGAKAYIKDGVEPEDLGGKLMTPGLIDGHIHAVMSVVFGTVIRLSPDQDLGAMKATIKEYVEAHPEYPTYMGMGWADEYFGEIGPNKADLDEICSDKPMVILSASGHCGWCNSKALEVAGVTADTPDPDASAGHLYVRDEKGNLTGYFKESLCMNKILGGAEYIVADALEKSAVEFANKCSYLGLTSLVDCGNYDFGEHLMNDRLSEVLNSKDCPVRLNACGVIGNNGNIEYAFEESVKLHKKYNSDCFSCTFLKILNDGTLENLSAAMPGAYPDGTTVQPTMSVDELVYWGEKAAQEGLDLNVHAIGTLTVHGLLEAAGKLREKGYNDMRITCSHSAYVFPEDIELFKKYNVLANSTARWFSALPPETTEMVNNITQAMSYPVKSINNTGAKISLSSDYPTDATTFLPMPNFEVAITRQLMGEKDGHVFEPEERLTLEEVIEAYTINNAYEMRMEDKIGTIEVGKYADLVVFDQNLFEIDTYTIHDVKIAETIKDGITRYKM